MQLLEIVKDFEKTWINEADTSESRVKELCSKQLRSLWKCLLLGGGEGGEGEKAYIPKSTLIRWRDAELFSKTFLI